MHACYYIQYGSKTTLLERPTLKWTYVFPQTDRTSIISSPAIHHCSHGQRRKPRNNSFQRSEIWPEQLALEGEEKSKCFIKRRVSRGKDGRLPGKDMGSQKLTRQPQGRIAHVPRRITVVFVEAVLVALGSMFS